MVMLGNTFCLLVYKLPSIFLIRHLSFTDPFILAHLTSYCSFDELQISAYGSHHIASTDTTVTLLSLCSFFLLPTCPLLLGKALLFYSSYTTPNTMEACSFIELEAEVSGLCSMACDMQEVRQEDIMVSSGLKIYDSIKWSLSLLL